MSLWQVERRTCNGKARSALRAAARDIRGKAPLAAKNTVKKGLSKEEYDYLNAIEKLFRELSKAGESDFDSHLKVTLLPMEIYCMDQVVKAIRMLNRTGSNG